MLINTSIMDIESPQQALKLIQLTVIENNFPFSGTAMLNCNRQSHVLGNTFLQTVDVGIRPGGFGFPTTSARRSAS